MKVTTPQPRPLLIFAALLSKETGCYAIKGLFFSEDRRKNEEMRSQIFHKISDTAIEKKYEDLEAKRTLENKRQWPLGIPFGYDPFSCF